jgi:classical protein kinase C alpha type
MRRPLTGKLIIRVSAVKDVDHASTTRFSRSPETYIVIKVEDVPRQRTKGTRSDRWNEEFELPVDKANEIEFTVYDKVGDNNLPIGFLWVRISDIAEELRRRKIEQEVAGSGWVSADKAQAGGQYGGQVSPGLSQVPSRGGELVYSRPGDAPGAAGQIRNEGVEAWFALEPAGQILLTLNFIKETRGKRPIEGRLGRQGAIRQRKEEVTEVYGHKFVMQQFYQIMRCALCGEFLKNAAGYQCEDCKYTCHKKCYSKVVTKCIGRTTAETVHSSVAPADN